MDDNYFDIDTILAEEFKISTQFLEGATSLGYLDNFNSNSDLSPESIVELPFWMVSKLYHDKLCQVQLPNIFNSKIR